MNIFCVFLSLWNRGFYFLWNARIYNGSDCVIFQQYLDSLIPVVRLLSCLQKLSECSVFGIVMFVLKTEPKVFER